VIDLEITESKGESSDIALQEDASEQRSSCFPLFVIFSERQSGNQDRGRWINTKAVVVLLGASASLASRWAYSLIAYESAVVRHDLRKRIM
jgi:hypothetical protein